MTQRPGGELVHALAAREIEVDRRDGDPLLGDGVKVGVGLVVVGGIVAVDVVAAAPALVRADRLSSGMRWCLCPTTAWAHMVGQGCSRAGASRSSVPARNAAV